MTGGACCRGHDSNGSARPGTVQVLVIICDDGSVGKNAKLAAETSVRSFGFAFSLHVSLVHSTDRISVQVLSSKVGTVLYCSPQAARNFAPELSLSALGRSVRMGLPTKRTWMLNRFEDV